MKVLVGHFTAESNEHVKRPIEFDKFIYKTGNDMIKAMEISDIFEKAGIELIPSIYANGHSGGCVSYEAFRFISSELLNKVRHHSELNEIDGIYLFLHGASKIIGLPGGSGEHYILKEIRKIVGEYMPIAIVMDPHGNLSQEFADGANIIRCYRESPHTDRVETHRVVARMFIDLLKNRRNIHPVYRKIPILLGGERCVSTDEPMVSINKLLNKIEQSNRIMSASYHIGYLRHDSPKCGASAIVVPNSEEDIDYAKEMADKIAEFALSKRHEFHYTGTTSDPDDAVQQVMQFNGGPVFLTDSGDNTTAGADGFNTLVLKQFMQLEDYLNKKILFAAITDFKAIKFLKQFNIGDKVSFSLGMDEDENSSPIKINCFIKAKGDVHNIHYEKEKVGDAITVSLIDKPIDIIISDRSITYAEMHQFEAAKLNIDDYDVIIVKQGYLFPDLKRIARFYIMSLTEGPTNQRTENIPFKKILRPMYPIDDF